MKLIYVDAGRSGVLISFGEIAPIGGIYLPDVSSEIVKRYEFVQLPDYSPEAIDKNGVMFRLGKFQETNIRALNVYRDGIMAECSSTEEALSVVTDLTAWLVEKFGFRKPSVPPDRVHAVSNLVVEFEGTTVKAFDKFDKVFKLASNVYRERYGLDREVTMSRFGFDIDPTTVTSPISSIPMFSIERQINQPFSSNRFWCQAPMHTRDHLKLLEEFEALMKG